MHACNQVYLEVSEESPHFTCVHVRQALNLKSGIMRKDMQSTYSVYTCIYHVLSSKVWNMNTCIYMILILHSCIYVYVCYINVSIEHIYMYCACVWIPSVIFDCTNSGGLRSPWPNQYPPSWKHLLPSRGDSCTWWARPCSWCSGDSLRGSQSSRAHCKWWPSKCEGLGLEAMGQRGTAVEWPTEGMVKRVKRVRQASREWKWWKWNRSRSHWARRSSWRCRSRDPTWLTWVRMSSNEFDGQVEDPWQL